MADRPLTSAELGLMFEAIDNAALAREEQALKSRPMDADTRIAELEVEASRLAADRSQWRTRYYEESRTYWDAELPPGGECCAVCGQPVESEPCAEHHPATVAARLQARVTELESTLAERTKQLNGLLDALSFDEKAVPA